MPLKDEFSASVQNFLNSYTVYLPGSFKDGGLVNLSDPAFAAFVADHVIRFPSDPVAAAWRPGVRPGHVKLLLKFSDAYKMLALKRQAPLLGVEGDDRATLVYKKGDYEASKENLILDAKGTKGVTDADAKRFAKSALTAAGLRVEKSEWFDCYFLPWAEGRKTKMQLGDRAPYFFTATMNGCSFRVKGNSHNPVVSHINTAKPSDATSGGITKQTIKDRYELAVGAGNAAAGLLSKYKPGDTFQGHVARYKMRAGELDAIDDKNLVDGAKEAVDINTSVVGFYDNAAGWRFFYQRTAVMLTKYQQTTHQIGPYKPANWFNSGLSTFGIRHGHKVVLHQNTTEIAGMVKHCLTRCTELTYG